MITSNVNLKNGLGNGTRCLGISLQLKKGCALKCKTWDGRMVHTVSCLDVEYMTCETISNNKNEKPRRYKLEQEKDMVSIRMKLSNMTHKIKVRIIQFVVNSNKATTVHKLQGVSLDRMVVRSWSYKFPNWVYVVLSRVRTLDGLFICKKLDENKTFEVDPKLLQEEERLQKIEENLVTYLNKYN